MEAELLHKKKELAPQLRFKEYKDKLNKKELGKICSFFSGGTPASTNKNFYSGNIPFIGSGNIYDSEVFSFITEEALESSSAKIVKQGDLLCALYGANSGEVAISKLSGAINQAILCIRTQEELIEFVYYLLLHNKEKIVSKYLQGGQGNLSANIVKSLNYYFPTLPEQQKIASFLSAVDEKIQQLTRKKELLEQYKKGVMHQLFSGKLRFKDENGKVFSKWEEKRLGEIAVVKMGQSPDSKSYNTYSVGMLLIQGNADINGRVTNPRQWTSEPTKICEIGDLILTVRAPVGSISKSLHQACLGRGVCSIKNNKISDIEYLFQFFLGYEDKWKKIEQGSTFTAVNGNEINSLKLNVPSLQEQKKIANYLSSIDNKIESATKQITQTQTFKKGLLQQMFI